MMFQKSFVLAACLMLAAPASLAQDQLSRTLDGHPDLQGRWTMRTLTPFARPTGISASSVAAEGEAALLNLIMQQRLAAAVSVCAGVLLVCVCVYMCRHLSNYAGQTLVLMLVSGFGASKSACTCSIGCSCCHAFVAHRSKAKRQV